MKTTYGTDPTKDALEATHPGACQESRYPNDDKLRANGFTIWARPKDSEARWRGPDGHLWTQSTALAWIAEQAPT